MFPDFLVSLAGGLVLAAALGYWYARAGESSRGLNWRFREYSEQLPKRSEKAVRAYLREAEKESSEPDAAFELAAYFRSGGDWRRALQIHEAIAARSDLDAATRAHAGLEIGDDYRAAGMLDRSEEAYARTAEYLPLRLNALERQLGVCEQLADWERAVDVADQVRKEDPDLGSRLRCHYLCELAVLAVREGHMRQARSCWRKAARRSKDSSRLLVDRAVYDERSLAGTLSLAGRNPDQAVLILLGASRDLEMPSAELNGILNKQLKATPSLGPALACTLLMTPELLCATSAQCLFAALNEKLPAYGKMYASGAAAEFSGDSLRELTAELQATTGSPPGWRCSVCGQQQEGHNWRCNECGAWDAAQLISPLAA